MRKQFSDVLTDFANLNVSGDYVGSLKGITAVVKEDLANNNITYYNQGDVIEDLLGLEGVRIFVLGPPKLYEDVKQEHGDEEGSFDHNQDLSDSDLFVRAVAAGGAQTVDPALLPFEKSFIDKYAKLRAIYEKPKDAWRRIDDDWLFSSGSFAACG